MPARLLTLKIAFMPRFVLLLHECPKRKPRPTHCDLMFDVGYSLSTWALATLPHDWRDLFDEPQLTFASTNEIEVDQLPDHRTAYLDYEGPVSSDRGSVRRLDSGTYTTASGPYEFAIDGRILRGTIRLQPPAGSNATWQLTFTAQGVPR